MTQHTSHKYCKNFAQRHEIRSVHRIYVECAFVTYIRSQVMESPCLLEGDLGGDAVVGDDLEGVLGYLEADGRNI